MTGQDLSDRAGRGAGGLAAMGIGEGDSIALRVRNVLAFFEDHAAAALVGAYSPCPPHVKHAMIEWWGL